MLADEHNFTKIDQEKRQIEQNLHLEPHDYRFYYTLIYVISMEFLLLSRRRSSLRNIPSSEEQGETAVFCRLIIEMMWAESVVNGLSLKQGMGMGNGEWEWEWGTGNGECLKAGIFKSGNL